MVHEELKSLFEFQDVLEEALSVLSLDLRAHEGGKIVFDFSVALQLLLELFF